MLIKSIKHDLMATYRDFVGIYVALLVAAVIGPFVFQTGNEIVSAMTYLALMGLVVATLVITFLTIIRLYNQRLFSNEGYLTLTLPVKTHITIISKVITGLIWSIATGIIFITAALIFYGIYVIIYSLFGNTDIGYFINMINELFSSLLQWEVIKILLIQLPINLISSVKDLVLVVFVMTFVNTSFVKKGKLPIGIVIYMVLGSIINGISTAILMAVTGVAILFSGTQNVFFFGSYGVGYTINPFAYTLQVGLMVAAILGLGFLSWWLLEHKLEIE